MRPLASTLQGSVFLKLPQADISEGSDTNVDFPSFNMRPLFRVESVIKAPVNVPAAAPPPAAAPAPIDRVASVTTSHISAPAPILRKSSLVPAGESHRVTFARQASTLSVISTNGESSHAPPFAAPSLIPGQRPDESDTDHSSRLTGDFFTAPINSRNSRAALQEAENESNEPEVVIVKDPVLVDVPQSVSGKRMPSAAAVAAEEAFVATMVRAATGGSMKDKVAAGVKRVFLSAQPETDLFDEFDDESDPVEVRRRLRQIGKTERLSMGRILARAYPTIPLKELQRRQAVARSRFMRSKVCIVTFSHV
jgi:hypothetical protein